VGVTEIPVAVAGELARLRAENARLLKMLELSPRQAAPPGPAQAGFFDAPPGPVHKDSPNDAKVAFFWALFAARTDIYATQYVGRILRSHENKTTAEVHDYLDERTSVLAAMLAKRAPGYTGLGFPDPRRIAFTPSTSADRQPAPQAVISC
jgi:hypothetical protein